MRPNLKPLILIVIALVGAIVLYVIGGLLASLPGGRYTEVVPVAFFAVLALALVYGMRRNLKPLLDLSPRALQGMIDNVAALARGHHPTAASLTVSDIELELTDADSRLSQVVGRIINERVATAMRDAPRVTVPTGTPNISTRVDELESAINGEPTLFGMAGTPGLRQRIETLESRRTAAAPASVDVTDIQAQIDEIKARVYELQETKADKADVDELKERLDMLDTATATSVDLNALRERVVEIEGNYADKERFGRLFSQIHAILNGQPASEDGTVEAKLGLIQHVRELVAASGSAVDLTAVQSQIDEIKEVITSLGSSMVDAEKVEGLINGLREDITRVGNDLKMHQTAHGEKDPMVQARIDGLIRDLGRLEARLPAPPASPPVTPAPVAPKPGRRPRAAATAADPA